MIISPLGNVTVPYSPEWNPNAGGGPISHGSGSVIYDPTGYPVYRSPTVNAYENEPGARWPEDLSRTHKFLQDGRLVRRHGFGQADFPAKFRLNVVQSIGPSVATAIGAGFGVALAPADHKVAGTLIGAVIGGIFGWIFSG